MSGQGRLDFSQPAQQSEPLDPLTRWYSDDHDGTVIDADPRFVVVGHDLRRKDATYEVFCAACKLRLVVGGGKDPAPGIMLALSNVTVPVRACCEAWLPLRERDMGGGEGGETD